jgi:DNA-binding NarL/FixJ family response regulator
MRQALVVGTDDFLIAAMRIALRHAPGLHALGMLERGGPLGRAIREAAPDLVLLEAAADTDLTLSRLRELHEECPNALVLLVAAKLDVEVFEEAGRRGMVACLGGPGLATLLHALLADSAADEPRPGVIALASPPPGSPACASAHQWGPETDCPLTARQLQILRAVAEGCTNAEIARELWLTEQTVKFHLSKIYRRLGVSNRTEASRYALLGGLQTPARPQATALSSPPHVAGGGWRGSRGHVNGHRALSGALH